ncbi:MAG: nitrous oxide reductase family maturation protein NosD [Flavobacteriaceae bacterium]|nr:nitrous oxide reductase family maturation protein NosD [Flavobacteriaceae bacterium]
MNHITLLFLFLGVLWHGARPPAVLEVCDSCTYKTVTDAIDSAQAYDTILIKAGTYKEFDLKIRKPLTILGQDLPTIDGQNQGEILTIQSDEVTIGGIRIINVGTSYTKDFAAIRVVKSKDFIIRDMVLEHLFFGIYLEKATRGKVLNNIVKGDAEEEFNSGNGIQLWHCTFIEVIHNHIEKVRDGIYLEFSDNINITGNTSKNNVRYGLHFMFSNNDIYQGNSFVNNGAGVAVMFSKKIIMKRNVFKENWGTAAFGLLLKEINDSEILDNHFLENTIGIQVEGANRVSYSNNLFRRNGWAVKVRGACYGNTFSGNSFINNSFDLSYNSNINDNVFKRNYWSEYTGYDLDKNGIGDVPYRPVKLFSYIVNRTPETIVLLRSFFMDLIDFSEKVSPAFTPDNLVDAYPLMKQKL